MLYEHCPGKGGEESLSLHNKVSAFRGASSFFLPVQRQLTTAGWKIQGAGFKPALHKNSTGLNYIPDAGPRAGLKPAPTFLSLRATRQRGNPEAAMDCFVASLLAMTGISVGASIPARHLHTNVRQSGCLPYILCRALSPLSASVPLKTLSPCGRGWREAPGEGVTPQGVCAEADSSALNLGAFGQPAVAIPSPLGWKRVDFSLPLLSLSATILPSSMMRNL
jgi:hypothetical protein